MAIARPQDHALTGQVTVDEVSHLTNSQRVFMLGGFGSTYPTTTFTVNGGALFTSGINLVYFIRDVVSQINL